MKTPKSEVFWYKALTPTYKTLESDITVDVVVVGGGMAGLSAAEKLRHYGFSVTLVEKDFCGAGASGKTSGFITPDSELELSDLIRNYGQEEGRKLWEFAKTGVAHIKSNIEKYNLSCDYQVQDSLFIASHKKGWSIVEEEHVAHDSQGYKNTLYAEKTVQGVIGSASYFGAIQYPNTFGINSFAYCQGMKQELIKQGVSVFEKTSVTHVTGGKVTTEKYTISAKYVVVCADRFMPSLSVAKPSVYSAQTFLAVSKPLSDAQVKMMFPERKFMVWDTELIYQYFRITGDKRLLLGAASMFYTYLPFELRRSKRVLRKMYKYLRKRFPGLEVEFEYMWPGLIGVSKDFVPIAGESKEFPGLYFAGAGAGLPWSAALGIYVAEKIVSGRKDFDQVFSEKRQFTIQGWVQKLITKPIAFALSHGFAKYFKK